MELVGFQNYGTPVPHAAAATGHYGHLYESAEDALTDALDAVHEAAVAAAGSTTRGRHAAIDLAAQCVELLRVHHVRPAVSSSSRRSSNRSSSTPAAMDRQRACLAWHGTHRT